MLWRLAAARAPTLTRRASRAALSRTRTAHRLNTIADSDRVMVLADGNIAEFDTPQNLMKKPGGMYRALVAETRSAANGGSSANLAALDD